jgi:phage FluMu protein Com
VNDAYGEGIRTDKQVRCWRCNKLLAESVTQPWLIKCTRCKATNQQGELVVTEDSD